MATYAEELESFKQQWNLPEYSLDGVANSVQQLRYTDTFLMGTSPDNSPGSQFVKWLSRTTSLYLAKNAQPNEDGKYLFSFDTQAFYDSFKKLVQAKYNADAEKNGTTPLDVQEVVNQKEKEIKTALANNKGKYKKTLPTHWKEQLKNGDITIETMQGVTNSSYATFSSMDVWGTAPEVLDAKLTNLVAAQEAMKQLRESRRTFFGWFWKNIFNRAQNRQEKEYLADLNTKIDALKGLYRVEEKRAELLGKTIFGKELSRAKNEKTTQAQQVSSSNNKSKSRMEPVTAQLSEFLTNNSIKNKVTNTLNEKLPCDDPNNAFTFQMTVQTCVNNLTSKKIQSLNEAFDAGIAKGNDPKQEMGHVVRRMFVNAVNIFGRMTSYTDNQAKLEAIKTFTQELTNNFTAVAIHPELGEYVAGYIELNATRYERLVSEGKNFSQEMDEFEEKLENGLIFEEEPMEKVFKDGALFSENSASITSPVQQQQQSVPTMTNTSSK